MFWNSNCAAKLVARTMDLFISDEPQMWVRPRGIDNQSKVDENGLKWRSVYGSVVISAFHHGDAITDGMNEQGLAVHALALRATQYEKRDHRPGVHFGECLQYLLDTCTTVEEAIEAHRHFQVVALSLNRFMWPLHLMIEDASGDSAVVEFVEGQMKVYHGAQYRVGTNDPTYDQHLKDLDNGNHAQHLTQVDSQSRFIRASVYLQQLPEPKDTHDAVHLLKEAISKLFQNDHFMNFNGQKRTVRTLWTVISDLTHLVYYFFPAQSNEPLRIHFANLDFSIAEPIELQLLHPISN